jgi:hypothetical protein
MLRVVENELHVKPGAVTFETAETVKGNGFAGTIRLRFCMLDEEEPGVVTLAGHHGRCISSLLFCEECVFGTYKSPFARTYLLTPGSKLVSRGVSCYWLLGAKEWGAPSLSSRLGLRLSFRVFGLLRMGSTVSLFAARSLDSLFADRSPAPCFAARSPASRLGLWYLFLKHLVTGVVKNKEVWRSGPCVCDFSRPCVGSQSRLNLGHRQGC